jgi:uncharacterized Tic20 family protein
MSGEYVNSSADVTPLDSEAKTWGMLCHVASLAGYAIPFGHIVGPLVAWQIKKDKYPFVDHHGKESLNFQITMTIALVVSFFLCLLLVGFFLLVAIPIFQIAFVIIAAVKASNGEWYRYPLTIRFIK